ncbi:uncharacterized protein N7473_009342 [Penicillium subrubescens]|uniref:Uncharacterized protein n=1 Tax=Penicillium subrubescens TaxID=1316194 RepID=A0A1Q5TAR3_9EURO|nr:uncharacterized protein N7473_009342 [Penicillium subrubescens]KAJ5886668.1 hypothetical protein N7473_009342 [Penicillium subrubescens]OKO97336.1 hypothetical protein PENSUB_10130 [Penicillium subrubescens]
MKFSIIPSVLALASCVLAAPSTLKPFLKRNPTGSFKLVAYSLESSVVDIFYSDGIAYAGDSSKWTYGSVTTDVTFVIEDTEVITTATTSGVTLDSDTLFYIRPIANQVLPVGFTGNGVTVPDDAVTTNFIFYGTYLMWEYDDGSLSDSFRARETNVTGVYELYYDFSNLYPSGYKTPVVKSSS